MVHLNHRATNLRNGITGVYAVNGTRQMINFIIGPGGLCKVIELGILRVQGHRHPSHRSPITNAPRLAGLGSSKLHGGKEAMGGFDKTTKSTESRMTVVRGRFNRLEKAFLCGNIRQMDQSLQMAYQSGTRNMQACDTRLWRHVGSPDSDVNHWYPDHWLYLVMNPPHVDGMQLCHSGSRPVPLIVIDHCAGGCRWRRSDKEIHTDYLDAKVHPIGPRQARTLRGR